MSDHARPLGILSAMPEEMTSLGGALDPAHDVTIAGFRFRHGRIDGHPVILAEAGVGKVAAGLVSSLLLDHFNCGALIFSGVAGRLDEDLAIGDIVIGDELIQHDYGALTGDRMTAYRPGVPPIGPSREQPGFRLEPRLRQAIAEVIADLRLPAFTAAGEGTRAARVRLGRILTGDQFINSAAIRDRLISEFKGQAVEMEGAALAQVCERFGAPCVVVRCLSDRAGEDSHIDFAAFLPEAAHLAAIVVRRLIPVVAARQA
jgi:adenosylhomocysteine nucleosidase